MPLSPRPRWLPFLSVGLAAAAGLAACSDPYEVKASLDTVEDTFVVASLNDTLASPSALVAVDIAQQSYTSAGRLQRMPVATRVGNDFNFDVAVDVRGDTAVFYPTRMVATALASVHRVGLQKSTTAFEAITAAPNGGYVFDTVAVAARVGETVIVASLHPVCSTEYNRELFAKIGVMAVDPALKQATLRVRLDPNCGFRSFLAGVPK